MAYLPKPFKVIVVSILLAFALAACGGEGANAPEESTTTPDPTPTTSIAIVDTSKAPPAPTPVLKPSPSPTPTPTPEVVAEASGREGLVAPELVGINTFVNTDPFTLEELRGDKVVLIDFWTYTCVNCIRTLPFIKEWHEKYADAGLVIVGIHAPEFEFEKDEENVRMAIEKWGLEYPVVMDNDLITWDAFLNRSWPAKYLIDKEGIIRYTHFGEGQYADTEDEIRKVLAELGDDVEGVEHGNIKDGDYHEDAIAEDPLLSLTRELYAGVDRNYGALQNGATPYVLHEVYYQSPNVDIEYADTEEEHFNQFIYLQGLWHNGIESLRHARETEDYEDYILVNFRAAEVNVVLTSDEDGEPYEVRVLVDDGPMKPEQAGLDIRYDDEGNSFMLVTEPRMYRIIQLDDFEGHELKLTSNSDRFNVFAYTFGAYTEAQPLP